MAHKTISSLIAHIFILSIVLALSGRAHAARGHPKTAVEGEMEQPEWFIKSDRSVLLPGIGRVLLPPGLGSGHHHSYYNPYTGGSGGVGGPAGGYSGSTGGVGGPAGGYSGSTGGAGAPHNYIPGGDDTFVPSPGYEVPNPGSGGGGVPASPQP